MECSPERRTSKEQAIGTGRHSALVLSGIVCLRSIFASGEDDYVEVTPTTSIAAGLERTDTSTNRNGIGFANGVTDGLSCPTHLYSRSSMIRYEDL